MSVFRDWPFKRRIFPISAVCILAAVVLWAASGGQDGAGGLM